ncbi:glycosyltransferase family 4 protein [Acinetobacter sp.]|uniref:glycosyltransferase family 4 protein n=1 Tax=Acinetobacter sp. TaxID=472 RepID=UPI0035B0810E
MTNQSAIVLDYAQAKLQQNKNQQNESKLPARKLRIAIVTETWPPEINGVSLSVMQLTKGLQRRGHKILLIRPQQSEKNHSFYPDQECVVRSQSIPKYPQMQFGWPQIFKIGQALDQFKADIVHIVTEGPLGLAALNQAKLRNIPISSGFHSSFHDFSRYFDMAFLVRPVRQYLKWFHNQTDLTLVPSEDTRQVLKDEFGLRCPMRIISRGVDNQRFNRNLRSSGLRRQWQADDNTTVLLSVGRVSPEKEVPFILKSYQELKKYQPQRKLKMVVVGDGPIREDLEKQYPDVTFMGAQMGEALAMCYASADVFLFASEVDTFGNVVLEALASGLPVLAYNYAAPALMVEHGRTGWLLPFADKQAWQKTLLNLPSLKDLAHMGQIAGQKVADCGWDRPVADFEDALLQYAKKPTMYVQF